MPTSEPELARIDSATADTPNIVDVHDVSVRFRDVGARDLWRVILGHPPEGKAVYDALRHVSLDVRKGEFVGLLGRNGAGKSTLLRTIGGIIEPESGEVRLLDHAIGLYGLGITGHAQLTGRDFTRRWLELSGMPTAQVKESIEEVADFTELGEYFDRPMKTYSTGMAARVFFGAITAVEAGVYLIDEILVVGDEYFSAKSWRRLRARLAGGASGVFATHDWSSMMKLCNRAYVLNSGEITDSGNAPEVARRYIEMPELTPGYAWFNDALPTELHAVSGQDVEWRFPVTVNTDEPLRFGLSVETFMKGLGWQHLLHIPPEAVDLNRGDHSVNVGIASLPLGAGSYLVNLFLSGVNSDVAPAGFDVRSWLYGNALTLTVTSDTDVSGHTVLPLTWDLRETQ